MKVTMSEESKRIITLEEAGIAKKIIADMKEDESTAAEYAASAVYTACGSSCLKVFEASATVARNRRAYDSFFEGSKDLDIWVKATAQTADGFCIVGAYLTDICRLTGDNNAEIATRMYTRTFKESC
jgi:hypothetical protein